MILVLSARHGSCHMVKRHLVPKDAERMMGGQVERLRARSQNSMGASQIRLMTTSPLRENAAASVQLQALLNNVPSLSHAPEPCAYLIGWRVLLVLASAGCLM